MTSTMYCCAIAEPELCYYVWNLCKKLSCLILLLFYFFDSITLLLIWAKDTRKKTIDRKHQRVNKMLVYYCYGEKKKTHYQSAQNHTIFFLFARITTSAQHCTAFPFGTNKK